MKMTPTSFDGQKLVAVGACGLAANALPEIQITVRVKQP
jgi:hypothetical protein